MAHTIRKKTQLLNRVRRLRGQVDAIERALEAEAHCMDVMRVAASVKGAANSLMAELIEDHIRYHVSDPAKDRNKSRAEGSEQLIDVVRTYLR